MRKLYCDLTHLEADGVAPVAAKPEGISFTPVFVFTSAELREFAADAFDAALDNNYGGEIPDFDEWYVKQMEGK